MHCGGQYPDLPPTIHFISQVNLPCVNPRNGAVDPKQLPCLANWKRENTMETVLIELRRYGSPTSRAPYKIARDKFTNLDTDTWPRVNARSFRSHPRALYSREIDWGYLRPASAILMLRETNYGYRHGLSLDEGGWTGVGGREGA